MAPATKAGTSKLPLSTIWARRLKAGIILKEATKVKRESSFDIGCYSIGIKWVGREKRHFVHGTSGGAGPVGDNPCSANMLPNPS